jgi:hypothetical protein
VRKLLLILICLFPSLAWADNHYLSTTGADSGTCTEGSPCATFAYAFTQMASGDVLLVADGTYSQRLRNPPNGTSGAYTAVQAVNTGAVTVSVDGLSDWYYALDLGSDRQYIQIEGIRFSGDPSNGTTTAGYIAGSYIKVFRCAFFGAHNQGNVSVSTVGTGAHHVLFEECWAWGAGRYKFHTTQAQYVIYRRCVARHDEHASGGSYPHSTFTSYSAEHVLWQNCISIDNNQPQYYTGDRFWGGFYIPKGNDYLDTNSTHVKGSIVLNSEAGQTHKDTYVAGICFASGFDGGTYDIEDAVIWGVVQGIVGSMSIPYDPDGGGPLPPITIEPATSTVKHVTVGGITTIRDTDPNGYGGKGFRFAPNANLTFSIFNSIFQNIDASDNSGIAIYDAETVSDYHILYGNDGNYLNTTQGTHDLVNTNPQMLYLVRQEVGSPGKGTASDGGDRGATILKRRGTSGALWGDTGYDTMTTDDLWPFPNEALIKTDFASYVGTHSGLPSGARGFAIGTSIDGSAQTLTKYIWEYLGNQIPSDIYGASSPGSHSGRTVGGFTVGGLLLAEPE